MTESQGNSAVDQKKKGSSKLVTAFAVLVIFWGLALLTATIVGGLLVVAAGCIILPKIREFAITSGFGGSLNNQRNLKIIAALFLIIGLILSSVAITNQNLNEWNKNKQNILSKLETNIQTNNLEEAKKIIDQYKSTVKNDPEFDAVVGKYQAAKEKFEDNCANAPLSIGCPLAFLGKKGISWTRGSESNQSCAALMIKDENAGFYVFKNNSFTVKIPNPQFNFKDEFAVRYEVLSASEKKFKMIQSITGSTIVKYYQFDQNREMLIETRESECIGCGEVQRAANAVGGLENLVSCNN